MVSRLTHSAPAKIGGVVVKEVDTLDGVRYCLEDESWLLIRPSGTEPVLRVYAEAPELRGVKALLKFGEQVATST
jgi:phosphomannomutase